MSYIDDIMGFNPSDLGAFQEPVTSNSFDANVYKTNPVKLSKAEDGHYRSRVRILYNPFNFKQSVVDQRTYFIQDAEGSLLVRSKAASKDPKVYRECPFHKTWSKLWYATEDQEMKREWVRKMFDSTNSQWCLVQVLEDENQPELVGKILVWKLPKAIYNKMVAKMNPSPESKKAPVAIMDYLLGLPLDLDVAPGPDDPKAPERKMREINYDLCDFDTEYAPIINVDGTPFFTDEELELIDAYVTAKAEVTKAKSAAKKEAAEQKVAELVNDVKALYGKAFEYLKENAVDLEKECGYQDWDEPTTTRVMKFLDAVENLRDPKIAEVSSKPNMDEPTVSGGPIEDPMMEALNSSIPDPDDLPF